MDGAGGAGSIGDRHGVIRSDAAMKSTLNSASAAASTPAMLRRYGTVFIPTRGPKASTLGLLRENRPESRFLPVRATF